MMARSPDIIFLAEYVKNVLYFATVRQGKVLKSTAEIHYFCIDNELIYENYYSDFGPLNLGCVYKYCKILNDKLKQHMNKQTIIHYTSIEAKKKANAAFLIGCFGILYLNLTPKDALKPLTVHGQSYRPFQDATQGDSIYNITLTDCFHAIKKARELGFFNFQDFNYEEYERLDKIQGGDLNWIVPGKFLAFIGPVDYSVSLYHPPEMYINYFRENNVNIVIRLNKRMYDCNVFNAAGIVHYDLFFPDGSCPPRHILFKFLQISEDTSDSIAVHCKAGLGRTGSLIGCYLIKHYRMSAHEAIGWMRICRPGSVIGHQQAWLEQFESWLIKQGNIYRKRTFQDTEKLPIHEYGIYSIAEKLQKQRPVIFTKSPSPPPPIQRQTRSEIAPPVRPQASRTREALSKTPQKEQYEWRVKSPKLNNQKIPNRGDPGDTGVARRGSGAGEPRLPQRLPTSSANTTKSHMQRSRERINHVQDANAKHISGYPPIPTFRTTQGPVIKTLNDARNFLIRSSLCNDHHKGLNSSVIVTPQHTYRMEQSYPSGRQSPTASIGRVAPSNYSGSTQPQHRRRLGRSPSPSPSSSPTRLLEQSRATNTPQPTNNTKSHTKDSKSALRDVLSRLRSVPREGSIGAASVGAASLGARRDAPVDNRAPSVRSDERPLATQGDMLNSIKFQRRFRDTFNADKINTTFQDKTKVKPQLSSAVREPDFSPKSNNKDSKDINSRTFAKTRPSLFHETSLHRDKPSGCTSKNLFGFPRPSSPKPRRSTANTFTFY